MIAERKPIHVADRRDTPEYRDRLPGTVELVELGGARTYITVPMLKEGRVVGGIAIYRPEVRPFTQKQIDLVSTFANQAVIAIENVRLFNETKEALEQQTATAEILKVISGSPTDIQPVFDAIAGSAARLCGASDVVIRLVEGDESRIVAHFGPVPVTSPDALRSGIVRTLVGRAIVERRTIHIPDLKDPRVRDEFLDSDFVRVDSRQIRSVLVTPLLRGDECLGAIVIRRREALPFSDKQVELLKTFADQAVIAIENVRLFNETKEALEQQTATADILRVISSSPTDLQPVFDAILEKAIRLCDAHMGCWGCTTGKSISTSRSAGPAPSTLNYVSERGPFRPPPGRPLARMIAERQPIHVADRRDSPDTAIVFRTPLQ